MDQSIDHRTLTSQEAALRHTRYGVKPYELSARGRAVILQGAVSAYVAKWEGLPPGFEPYDRRAGKAKVDYGDGISQRTKVMALFGKDCDTLLATTEGWLILEHQWGNACSGYQKFPVRLSVMDLEGLLEEVGYFTVAMGTLQTHLEHRLNHTVGQAARIAPFLEAVNLN